MMVYSQTAKVH